MRARTPCTSNAEHGRIRTGRSRKHHATTRRVEPVPDVLKLQKYSYRFAEQVLNSSLALKHEIESVLTEPGVDVGSLSRPKFNEVLEDSFCARGWTPQPQVFPDVKDPTAKMDFMKDRVGIEVEFGHPSVLGMDLLKFQIASYSGLDRIDVGVYIVTTATFQKHMQIVHGQKWNGSINYDRVVRYLPHFRSAIQVPVYVLGIDV